MITSYLNILVIFAMMFVGYVLTWRKWFDNMAGDMFAKVVLNISLPLNMFLNMTQKFSKEEFLALFQGVLLPFVSILVTFTISILYARITKVPVDRRGTFQTMFTASNTIFMGLPVNTAVFGERAIPYALLYYICNTTFFFTVGIFMMARDNQDLADVHLTFSWSKFFRKLLSPALLGFMVGIAWLLLELPLPKPLVDFSSSLGNLTTPLSMFVIGIIIYNTGLKNLKMDKDVFGVLLGRYVISPLIVYGLSFVIHVPEFMLKVFILQSAMPVQNSVPILARNYGADEEFATSGLTYSILSYFLVILVLLKLLVG